MKHILTIIAALFAITSTAQRQVYVITRDFPEFTHANRMKELKDFGTLDQMREKYPAAYSWWTGVVGGSDADFLKMNIASAVLNQACWSGHSGAFTRGALCLSYNSIEGIPWGYFPVDAGITIPRGRFVGAGTAIGTGGAPLFNPNASTEFYYDHAGWIDPRTIRAVLQTGNLSGGYYESVYVSDVRVSGNGPNFYDPSYTQHGIVIATMGEGAVVDRVEINTCNGHGLWVYGAGPGQVRYLSSFDNNMAGLCYGAEKSPGAVGMGFLKCDFLSFDNNVWGVLNNGGGGMGIGFIKSEDGLSSQRGRPKKGMTVIESHGWNDIVVHNVRDAVSGASPAAFVVNTLSNTSRIKVDSYTQIANNSSSANGRTALLMLPRSKEVYRTSDANGMKLEPISFEWKGQGTFGTFTSSTPMVKQLSAAQTRLGLASTYAGYDYAAGTPVLDLTFGGTAPPPPAPCTFVYSAWTACTGTQTRTYTASPSGCTGTPPADSLSRTCTVTPPPSNVLGIDPRDVTVVANSADTRSAGWATAYCNAWGIPTSNIVSVNAGTSHEASTASATAIRNAAQSAGRQFTALAFEYPSRISGQSITSYVTFGVRSVSALTVSSLFGYTGLKPFTDKGVRPSWLLVSSNYIRKDAHGTRPTGQAILHLAKDAQSGGNPRGSARAGQTATGLTVWDMRATNIGGGVNACNYINQGCFLSAYRPGTTPIIAGYQSTYALGTDGGAVWAKGFYGDHVTSWGGYLPNGNDGQTPLTYHLDKGASLSVGSVIEPWQGSGGSLSKQFVRVDLFHPRFVSGLPVGVAAWSAIECPDRMLVAGDGMCAPFAR